MPARDTYAEAAAIIDTIYDAALDQNVWADVLTRMADATRSVGGLIYRMDAVKRVILGRSLSRLDPELTDIYERHHFMNPWAHYMLVQPAGAHVLSDEVLSLSELRRSSFFSDVLGPQGIGHSSMAVLVHRPDIMVGFTLCRSPEAGQFDAESRRFIEGMLLHLQRASQLHLRVSNFDKLRDSSLALLDRLAMGVVILDRWGGVLFANASAERSTQSRGLVIKNRLLTAQTSSPAIRLRQLVHDAAAGGAGGAMTIADPLGAHLPLYVLVAPLRGRAKSEVAGGLLQDPAVAVFVRDPDQAALPQLELLVSLLGLTHAECRVAQEMLQGEEPSVIASKLGITINTLKTHSKRIFAKLGVKRHAEFVRFVKDRIPDIDG